MMATLNEGDEVIITFVHGGSWSGECGYEIADSFGNVVVSEVGAGGGSTDAGPADSTLTASCVQMADVTFTVNTANITVGDNGMYLGGGVFGGANAVAMSDADADGTWEVTVAMEVGTTGNLSLIHI